MGRGGGSACGQSIKGAHIDVAGGCCVDWRGYVVTPIYVHTGNNIKAGVCRGRPTYIYVYENAMHKL